MRRGFHGGEGFWRERKNEEAAEESSEFGRARETDRGCSSTSPMV
jgi:hypothetical protein